MKNIAFGLLLGLLAAPALADNLLDRAVTFGRELLDETRKLAPGIQHDRRHEPTAVVPAQPDDGRDRPAIEPGPTVYPQVVPAGEPATGQPGFQFAEEDHLNPGQP
ncbi:hypothetical protein C7H85_12660 [Zobellella endophytica]|uniref:DUF2339 domain-containing protein n=1 Tax=Zobellella endophytica TaxID=2116700 RepID=A0A2P7R3M3_9GAMM|nr:hypothetical protein [Zobellella endophytica]PSJ44819.1 hypothetical protein C7H85_12660 [Zobellella endophytica]